MLEIYYVFHLSGWGEMGGVCWWGGVSDFCGGGWWGYFWVSVGGGDSFWVTFSGHGIVVVVLIGWYEGV